MQLHCRSTGPPARPQAALRTQHTQRFWAMLRACASGPGSDAHTLEPGLLTALQVMPRPRAQTPRPHAPSSHPAAGLTAAHAS
jgi:hypothetical protein